MRRDRHRMNECDQKQNCILCEKRGFEKREHVAGSIKCPVYRKCKNEQVNKKRNGSYE